MVGGDVLAGGACGPVTTAVWAESADDEPAEFVPVTRTRTVEPTSETVGTYVPAVAPTMSTQAPPAESQRRHW